MIKGIGIDITEIKRIQEMLQKHPQFVDKILTPAEKKRYEQLGGPRALEYLAGRWSLKESFSKAYGTGIGSAVDFQDIEIVDVTKAPFEGRVHASVSHTAVNVITEILLEETND